MGRKSVVISHRESLDSVVLQQIIASQRAIVGLLVDAVYGPEGGGPRVTVADERFVREQLNSLDEALEQVGVTVR